MKWIASIVAAIGALTAIFAPQLQAAISAHPAVSAVIAAAYAILAHFLPAPAGPAAVPTK